MAFYFAYGSNMSRAGMRARCPAAQALGVARLSGWRYIVTADGYASIVPAAGGSSVQGVLWRLSARDLAVLNAYELLDSGLYRLRALPVRHDGGTLRALTYVGRGRAPGRPRPGYQAIVLEAAGAWAFPAAYVTHLARFAPRPQGRLARDSGAIR